MFFSLSLRRDMANVPAFFNNYQVESTLFRVI